MNKTYPSSSFSVACILAFFTLALIIFQSYWVMYCNSAGLHHISLFSYLVFDTVLLKNKIIFFSLLRVVVFHLFFYILCYFLIWHSVFSVQRVLSWGHRATIWLTYAISISATISIAFANAIYFPHSVFAWHVAAHTLWFYLQCFVVTSALMIIGITCCVTVIDFWGCLLKRSLNRTHYIFLFTFLLFGLSRIFEWLIPYFSVFPTYSHATALRPNVILIGIDGLRFDYIRYADHQGPLMPHLLRLLNHGIEFSNAYTPIAQTFPAWISVLTAKYPFHTGARGFYMRNQDFHLGDTLVNRFNQMGYETVYATDQQAHSEMNRTIGFNQIISAEFGAAEWVNIFFNDSPLFNLLLHTSLGKWLFPYLYANRVASVTYYPGDFLSLLKSKIQYLGDKPVFLALHFNLSHWPFFWANDGERSDVSFADRYRASLHAVDQQLNDYLNILKTYHLLDHAIVVLFSDHGMGLGIPGDRIISESHYLRSSFNTHSNDLDMMRRIFGVLPYQIPFAKRISSRRGGIDTSYFYGDDVLSIFSQHRVLLAFLSYGMMPFEPSRHIPTRVSLLDVAPTLLHILHFRPLRNVDGYARLTIEPSLKQFSKSQGVFNTIDTPLFFETGFQLLNLDGPTINISEILKAASRFVAIDSKTGLLFFRPDIQNVLIHKKQHAVLIGKWLLVHYPSKHLYHLVAAHDPNNHRKLTAHQKTNFYLSPYDTGDLMTLVNVETHDWTTDWHSTFAKCAPLCTLWNALRHVYHDELHHPINPPYCNSA